MDFFLNTLQNSDVRALLKGAVLPPSLNIWLGLLGVLLSKKFPKTGCLLIIFSLILLYLLSTTLGELALNPSQDIVRPLDIQALVRDIERGEARGESPQAIVILGGGRYGYSPEYHARGTVSDRTLVRLRYGAKLHRETGLPVLVTGWGEPYDQELGEVQMMANVLTEEFSVPVRWIEGNSRTTAENALYIGKMLLPQGIDHIVLVTEVGHMARAQEAFLRNGFKVMRAPTGYGGGVYASDGGSTSILKRLTPNAETFRRNVFYLHERLGTLWYRLAALWKQFK